MKYRSAAITDIGKTRHENEDRFMRDEGIGLFGVADGIGGLPGGAEAAEHTVAFISDALRTSSTKPDPVAITLAASAGVRELGQTINPPYGIGSTLTFGLFHDGRLQLAHVGDSRAYAFQQGELLRLTEDHTVENEFLALRARGEKVELSPENRNALTRCIGQPGVPEVDFQELLVAKGDRYLFTTDGICRMITDEEIAEIIAGPETPETTLQIILELALKRGGFDNLTAVLVYIDEA